MKKALIVISVIFALLCCGCKSKYNGAHIIAGALNGDVEIVWSESVNLRQTELTLKDGTHIQLDKGNFILFRDVCPICGADMRR